MRTTSSALLAVALVASRGAALGAEDSPPKLMVSAYGGGALIIENGKVIEKIKTKGGCQDAWALPDGSRLIVGAGLLTKYDAEGEVIFTFRPEGKTEMHNCMPLPGGNTMVAENGTPSIIELDPKGKVVKRVNIQGIESDNVHMRIRGARKRANGEYVVMACADNKLLCLNSDGSLKSSINLKQLPKPLGAGKSHGVAILPSGNILAGTGSGKSIVEFDGSGEVVWSLSQKDVPELGIKCITGMHVLENGNIAVSAYNSTYTLFEITRDKEVVWKILGSRELHATHVQVLTDERDPQNFMMSR